MTIVADPTEYMCPNCVTPWKCNGPHIPQLVAGDAPWYPMLSEIEVTTNDWQAIEEIVYRHASGVEDAILDCAHVDLLEELHEAVVAYLDPENQYTESRLRSVERALEGLEKAVQ